MGAEASLKERIALAALSGGLLPASQNGSQNSGTIDMSKGYRCQFIVTMGSACTLNAYIKQSANANGAGAANVATQNVASSNTLVGAANTLGTLEMRADQMTLRYALCQIVIDVAAVCGITGLMGDPRFGPANASDNATFTGSRQVLG